MLPLLRSAKYYLYEPDSFVPVAQALRKAPIRLLRQPDWRGREYDIDQDPLWQHEVKPQPIDAIAWYQCDYLGTPMELTDHHGEVAWAGQYKAWGDVREVRSDWAKQVGMSNPIRFQGQYHDHETGLHYNRYRYYDPRVGRFVSQDPIRYAGGLNLFAYTPNPIFWVDTRGLTPTPLNEPGYIVYGLYKPDDEIPYYIGHTKQDPLKREAQHAQSGRLGNGALKPVSEGLTYTQSKGQEQYYREVYDTKTGFPGNIIEPIDKSRQDERGRSHVAEYERIKSKNTCEL